MNINKITEIQLQILINESLYKKNYIDESTYTIVNDKLLKSLKQCNLVLLLNFIFQLYSIEYLYKNA